MMHTGSVTATLAAVLSAVLHAGWNALVKSTSNARAATLLTLSGAFIVTWLGALALAASGALGSSVRDFSNVSPWVLLAGLGEVTYVWSLGQALARGPLGVTYALSRAVAMLAVWPLSFVVFRAGITIWGIVGSLLVCIGIACITPAKKEGTVALGYTILSGLSVGVYHTGYKGCVRAGMPFAQAFAYALLVAVPLLWLLLARSLGKKARLVWQHSAWKIIGAALGCAGSFLLAVWALARADSGVVLGLRNSSIGFALLFALLLGERPRPRDWLGLLCFAASVFAFAYT